MLPACFTIGILLGLRPTPFLLIGAVWSVVIAALVVSLLGNADSNPLGSVILAVGVLHLGLAMSFTPHLVSALLLHGNSSK